MSVNKRICVNTKTVLTLNAPVSWLSVFAGRFKTYACRGLITRNTILHRPTVLNTIIHSSGADLQTKTHGDYNYGFIVAIGLATGYK